MSWSQIARDTITKVSQTIPDGTPAKERRRIISEAYPFGERKHWPYKAWLKAVSDHMAWHETRSWVERLGRHKSPLERMMAKANRVQKDKK